MTTIRVLSFFVVLVACAHAVSFNVNFNNHVCTGTTASRDCNEFDYIIVGAGAAGATLAAKLSADPSNRVLLLEQGGYARDPNIWTAETWFPLQFDPQLDLGYSIVPQDGLLTPQGDPGRTAALPRAGVVGGCQSHNGMVFITGNNKDYDSWANEFGNAGWDSASLQPFLEELLQKLDGKVWQTPAGEPFYDEMLAAAQEAGYEFNPDPNTGTRGKQEGVAYRRFLSTVDDEANPTAATRVTAYSAFIDPVAKDRPNLVVRVFSRATKILFSETAPTLTATGVTVTDIGTFQQTNYYARKEVILAGGAVDSPRLLLLSGVGPEDELEALGIPVVHNLPGVGKNIQNHLFVPIFGPRLQDSAELPVILHGNSGLLIIGGEDETKVPTYYLGLQVGPGFAGPALGVNCVMCFAEFQNIQSRGHLELASADPMEPPLIDPNYFDAPADIANAIDNVRRCRTLFEGTDLQPLLEGDELYPGVDIDTDEEISTHIRSTATDDFHIVGGCNMGPSSNDMAVVDNRLRVHGINNLRVVDNSIQPKLFTGNPAQPAMIIGLKAAKMILEDN